ncbi:adenylyltransferase/cytidyltransferase family protein [Candidatus Dojkabacteria bacterium]|uniref:Adenylyltransferase/cytidyltransferase family protein n=1 Tax=Candidatus Dojkabacteria bacterium TaxID=2099670 RepID=A0A955RHN3_9BACT|nr:adenylyltransferase/cytidyltransferase family protein [Candidatus Dojkabacteria bacterium]
MKYSNVLSLNTILRITHDFHKGGKVIGVTHGAFDLFHPGHLYLLEEAAKKCDFLVVGVESDEHVKSYKSYKRPIIDEKSRLQIISGIECVDAVFLNNLTFDSETFTSLYKEMHADLVISGNDFGYEDRLRMQAERAGAKAVSIKSRVHDPTTIIIKRVVELYSEEIVDV